METKGVSLLLFLFSLSYTILLASAFGIEPSLKVISRSIPSLSMNQSVPEHRKEISMGIPIKANEILNDERQSTLRSLSFAAALALATFGGDVTNTGISTAMAYDDMDYASETVSEVVQSLKDSVGSVDKTFKVFEGLADIITEGKGVGGSLSYTGVTLERGYVADEDTTIYNPGLSLLSESEKTRLVNSVIANRKENVAKKTWSENNQYAYEFLKQKLDPLHMVELKGYLSILPFWGAFLYLISLAVQQFQRDLFPVAYVVSALAAFVPIFVLIAAGP
eukprot:CAMPEP_0184864716 /NCGR_PEP_ID=MMETSP0580-20130426/15904_1 /TAXON_ID=1118495 /ORGANISM="Dactyliosolen fragilissimus" /LENGTH=278 /DNA_ID=CAMNT_0027363619 /DNA_START=133 /DNA_END=969 /DNA_ORIENTATION=+